MKAWIDNQRGVGYVVCWLENHPKVAKFPYKSYHK